MDNFTGLKYFNPLIGWPGDPKPMDRALLLKLDELRSLINSPIIVTSAFRKGKPTSQHEYGRAVDVIAPKIKLDDFRKAAEAVGFEGIGVYPKWMYRGASTGGLHLDTRPADADGPARWMGVPDQKGGQVYIGYTESNFKAWGVT